MSDTRLKGEEMHGISSATEDTAQVVAGFGETAKREGAKTKAVHSVSCLFLLALLVHFLT